MAGSPNFICFVLQVPQTLTPLASLMQTYFAAKYAGYVFDPVFSTVQYASSAQNLASTIYVGDANMANVGTASMTGVGAELTPGTGFSESSSGGGPATVDVSPVYVQCSSATANILLARCRRA